MKIAFQMDPIGPIDINADSTFRIAEEAQARGHELVLLHRRNGWPMIEGQGDGAGMAAGRYSGSRAIILPSGRGNQQVVDLSEFDVVWLRQDPPFDMFYITTTHILERLTPGHAGGQRSVLGAKLSRKAAGAGVSRPDAADHDGARDLRLDAIKAFKGRAWGHHPQAALWQRWARACSVCVPRRIEPRLAARAVHRVQPRAVDRSEVPAGRHQGWRQAGDPGDGEPVGAINRVPWPGETRSNMHVGGRPEKIELSDAGPRDLRPIGPLLRDQGAGLRRDRRDRSAI